MSPEYLFAKFVVHEPDLSEASQGVFAHFGVLLGTHAPGVRQVVDAAFEDADPFLQSAGSWGRPGRRTWGAPPHLALHVSPSSPSASSSFRHLLLLLLSRLPLRRQLIAVELNIKSGKEKHRNIDIIDGTININGMFPFSCLVTVRRANKAS